MVLLFCGVLLMLEGLMMKLSLRFERILCCCGEFEVRMSWKLVDIVVIVY